MVSATIKKKTVSTNALTDLVSESVAYVPVHHAVLCAVQTYTYGGTASELAKNFGACVASPPDLIDGVIQKPRIADVSGQSVDRIERFDSLFNVARRMRRRRESKDDKN